MLFAILMSYLTGAIDVLLFLIIRPGLLLFPRPERLPEPEMELAPQSTGPAIFSDTAKFQHSPEPTSAALGDEDSRDNASPSDIDEYRATSE
jgi:hypothetical protein